MSRYLYFLLGTLLVINGCGGGSSDSNEQETTLSSALKDYTVTLCPKSSSELCSSINGFGKDAKVALLVDSKVGVTANESFQGRYYLVIDSSQKEISAFNALAKGLYDYSNAKRGIREGGRTVGAGQIKSYEEAKRYLKERFNITGTKEQEKAILEILNKNLDLLGKEGLALSDAYTLAIESIAEALFMLKGNSDTLDMSSLRVTKKKDKLIIVFGKTAIEDPTSIFLLTREESFQIAKKIRKERGKEWQIDALYNKFTCPSNTTKHIKIYGINDNFSANFSEPTFYSFIPYSKPYDSISSIWALQEKIDAIPNTITKATFAIGLKKLPEQFGFSPNRYFTIKPSLMNNISFNTLSSTWQNPIGSIYTKDLSTLLDNNNNTILDDIQNGLTTLIPKLSGPITADFMALMYCQKEERSDKDVPMKDIPSKLECKANEQHYILYGGIEDDFALSADATNPQTDLLNSFSGWSIYKYDDKIDRGVVLDSITLPSNKIFTQAELLINTRAQNINPSDRIYIGSATNNQYLSINPNSAGYAYTLNNGVVHRVTGSTTNTIGGGNLLSTLNSESALDIAVKSHTQVDSVRLSLCAIDKEPQKSDIAIKKSLKDISYSNGITTMHYSLSFSGFLPQNGTITIMDTAPIGVTFSAINAPTPWNCSPQAPINSGTTLLCSISGYLSAIPTIEITAQSKSEKNVTNCAAIIKGNNTYYNTNPDNDKSCVETTLPDNSEPNEICKEQLTIKLSDPNFWKDSNGNSPVVDNVFANTQWANILWDGALDWFNFGYPAQDANSNALSQYQIEFCSCEANVNINEFKSDNYGKIYLDSDPTPNSFSNPSYIVYRNLHSQSTMASWGPNVSGSQTISYTPTPSTHTLNLVVKNIYASSGAAIDGELILKGKLGPCSK